MENNRSVKVKNMLCFIPFFSFVMYFFEEKKTQRIIKNIYYAWFFMIIVFVLSIIFTKFLWLWWILYILVSSFFWYKAYIWEDIDLEFINNIFLKK